MSLGNLLTSGWPCYSNKLRRYKQRYKTFDRSLLARITISLKKKLVLFSFSLNIPHPQLISETRSGLRRGFSLTTIIAVRHHEGLTTKTCREALKKVTIHFF